jgi:hypothetical protein
MPAQLYEEHKDVITIEEKIERDETECRETICFDICMNKQVTYSI